MKKIYFFIFIITLLCSCSEDENSQIDETLLQFENQKWELFRTTGNVANSERTGEDMEWQEYYFFKLDGTFEKVREIEGLVSKATGSFEVIEYNNDDADYLELTYESGLELIGSCTGDLKEVLVYRTSTIVSNTWFACDGPGLDYMLVDD